MSEIRRLNSQDSSFAVDLERLLDWDQTTDPAVESVVRDIIADVRTRGDAAVIEYTQRFDRWSVSDASEL